MIYYMTPSRIFFCLCLSFIGGIFINSLISVPQVFIPGVLIFGLILISVLFYYKRIVVIGFCVLFLVLGIWRHQQTELGIKNNELRKYNATGQEINLIGVVSRESDIRSNNIKLTVEVQNINQDENISRPIIDGKVLVTTNRYPEYQYGDKLKITGELSAPKDFEDFNYRDYLAKDGIYSVMYYPKIQLLEKEKYMGPAYAIYSKVLKLKNKLRDSIYQNLSPPQSSILGAIILGDKRKISDEWKEKLNISGLRHITAISGMHVVILSSILMSLLIGLGLWRQQAFYFSIVLIASFVIMTGLQPSAVRAGIMAGLFLLAQYLGRQKSVANAIALVAVIMLIQNPLLLKSDVGFQLSFLAMLGIIYLLPVFRDWIYKYSKKIPNILRFKDILAMTLAAQVFTLPILIYNFGYISLVSPLTNILIVPVLPYIMGSGFIFGILGIISQTLGWVLSWPSWMLLSYLTGVVNFFSQISWASLTLEISWPWIVIFYLILGYFTWQLSQKQRFKFLNY